MANVLDLEDSKQRGTKIARERMERIRAKWNRPTTEAKVGDLWESINADPGVAEWFKTNMPQEYAQMEARYGTRRV